MGAMNDRDSLLSAAEQKLSDAALPPDTWAFDRLEDERPCLLLNGSSWVAGYYERGSLRVQFETEDMDHAICRFVEWVIAGDASSRLSAEATDRWLRRTGGSRP